MTKVTIENFQSIRKVSFDIDGFTVIVGRNNIGKSAIMRAIIAALSNRAGRNYIRENEKFTEVRIQRADLDATWRKADKATYTIRIGDKEEKFSALNRDIPQPLVDAGFGKIEMGEQSMSPIIAAPFNPLFLIDESGPVVTEVLASLYNLNVLSTADELCQKEVKAKKSSLKLREADLIVLKDELGKYTGFESLKAEIENITETEKRCNALQAEIDWMKSCESKIDLLSASLKRLEKLYEVGAFDTQIIEAILVDIAWFRQQEQTVFRVAQNVQTLKPVLQIQTPAYEKATETLQQCAWLTSMETEVTRLTEQIKRLGGVAGVGIPEVGRIPGLITELANLYQLEQTHSSCVTRVGNLETVLASVDTGTFPELLNQGVKLLEEFKSLGELEQGFLASATTTKSARDAFRQASSEWEDLEKERKAFNVCPACERPL